MLASVDWEQKFPLVTVQALSRGISDHTQLFVNSGEPTHLGNKNVFSFEMLGLKEMASWILWPESGLRIQEGGLRFSAGKIRLGI